MGLLSNPDVSKNDEGYKLLNSGNKVEGLKLIREAALNGQPNALSTLIWHLVIDDQIKSAIKDYEIAISKTVQWIASEKSRIDKLWFASARDKSMLIDHYQYQVANSKSNIALAYLALGKEDIATNLWNEAAESHGHIEARFYPIFHLCKSNPNASIGVLKNSFTKQELQSLIEDLVQASTLGNGWFSRWAKSGIEVLKKASQGKTSMLQDSKKVAAAGGAAAIVAKNLNKFAKDQIEESLDEGGEPFDWLQDLF